LLVSQKDLVTLADAIERLLCDPDLRVRLAMNARQLIERDFDIRRNAALRREIFGGQARATVEAA